MKGYYPYTKMELETVAKSQVMDIYHKELMLWALSRINYLERERKMIIFLSTFLIVLIAIGTYLLISGSKE